MFSDAEDMESGVAKLSLFDLDGCEFDTCQAEGLSGTAVVSRIGPSVSSMSATKSAIRS